MEPSGERAFLEPEAETEELQTKGRGLLSAEPLQVQPLGNPSLREVFSTTPEPATQLVRATLTSRI